jgi:hypothetical protein
MPIDYKFILGIISAFGGLFFFFPYIRDIFKKKTRPHLYTWLIWIFTQSISVYGMVKGGAGIGSFGLVIATVVVYFTFFLSIRFGTKNITKIDTVLLVLALIAVAILVFTKNVLFATILATATDTIGYIPSIRKSYYEPWSETVSTWLGFTFFNFLAIAALRQYNALTLMYLTAITAANMTIALVCILRRRKVPRPLI